MTPSRLDLNCDLGEGEPHSHTRAMMHEVTSVNVACGGHAGDLTRMEYCVDLAQALGVHLGAHPGLSSRADFGRGHAALGPNDLSKLIVYQISALQKIAELRGFKLHHVKLHGTLYHLTDSQPALADAYAEVIRRDFPGLILYCRSGGLMSNTAREQGLEVMEEIFADRAYFGDGSLVPRYRPDAVLQDPVRIKTRMEAWLNNKVIDTVEGGGLRLTAQTICVHGDTEGSVKIARIVKSALGLIAMG